jgi:mycothiol synthase
MQVATRRDGDASERVHALAEAMVRAVDDAGGGEIDWWVYQPDDAADGTADAAGFAFDRDLLQMRRDLPAERRSEVATRSFVVGRDEPAWLTVNNRAFAGHAEQGGWTLEMVRQRMDQPWFDPGGLRLHERDGRLAAFCWTKIHESPIRTGEIYVIGVDPDFQGLGLGRELTLAGLDHMVDLGVGHAMLYVDGANDAARALYLRLGFSVARTDRAFRRASRVSK